MKKSATILVRHFTIADGMECWYPSILGKKKGILEYSFIQVIWPLLTINPFASRTDRKDAARPWSSSLAPGESGTLVFTGWAETDGEMRDDSTRTDAAVIESAPTRHSIRTNTNFFFMVHEIFSRTINSP
jgi:hypothetical protein